MQMYNKIEDIFDKIAIKVLLACKLNAFII